MGNEVTFAVDIHIGIHVCLVFFSFFYQSPTEVDEEENDELFRGCK